MRKIVLSLLVSALLLSLSVVPALADHIGPTP